MLINYLVPLFVNIVLSEMINNKKHIRMDRLVREVMCSPWKPLITNSGGYKVS